jgi:hypothetical protein
VQYNKNRKIKKSIDGKFAKGITIYKCKICKRQFKPNVIHAMYCSDNCYKTGEKIKFKENYKNILFKKKRYDGWKKWVYKNKIYEPKIKIKCKCCKKYFIRNNKNQIYCMKKQCRREMWNKKAKKIYLKNYDKLILKRKNNYRKIKKEKSNYYISLILRARLKDALKNKGIRKTKNFKELLGCSIEFFKKYIEQYFKKGMSWKNYGFNGWHFDHYVPCANFDLRDIKQQKLCFHYTNLKPLWAKENFSKGKRYIGDYNENL